LEDMATSIHHGLALAQNHLHRKRFHAALPSLLYSLSFLMSVGYTQSKWTFPAILMQNHKYKGSRGQDSKTNVPKTIEIDTRHK
jgi:hypothetical protein